MNRTLHCPKCLASGTAYKEVGTPCPTCGTPLEVEPTFAELTDALPEPMTCGRRFDQYVGGIPVHADQSEGQDHWDRFKSNGDRVCSYCGSLHPDDWFRLVKASAEASVTVPYGSVPEIEPSDKGYKIYVQQPGVRNAHQGGIKFYTQHLRGLTITEEQQLQFVEAKRRSRKRFDIMLAWRDTGNPPPVTGPETDEEEA